MNAEVWAEWLRRQGYRVIRTRSSYWFNAGSHAFQAIPHHWTIDPPKAELRELMLGHHLIAARYSAPFRTRYGKVSYHMVCENPEYDLCSMPRQARQNVGRGLKKATIDRISISQLASEGWRLRYETLERQGRLGDETEEMWRRLCLSAEDLPGFEAWGAFCDGQLQGSFLAFQCDDVYTLPYQQSATAYLQFRINNALFFHVTREVIRRPGISAVYFGLEPLTDSSRGDHFKFSMGLTARAIRQRVVFHPWLAPVLARPTCLAAKWFLGQRRQAALAKAAGMLRFYREGNRPPAEQEWPACLDGQRNVLLTTLCSQSSEDS